MVDRVALSIGSALGEVGARVRTAPSPALLHCSVAQCSAVQCSLA